MVKVLAVILLFVGVAAVEAGHCGILSKPRERGGHAVQRTRTVVRERGIFSRHSSSCAPQATKATPPQAPPVKK